jgi:uncharacterized protein (DUF1499 family)
MLMFRQPREGLVRFGRMVAFVLFVLGAYAMIGPAKAGWLSGTAPVDLGVKAGMLKPCPDSPNCVNSQSSGRSAILPIAFRGDAATAWRTLQDVLAGMERLQFVERTDNYLRVEARSRMLGFVDDVEFLLDIDAHVIHMRSASRLGYSDLGANRDRLEQVRSRITARWGQAAAGKSAP